MRKHYSNGSLMEAFSKHYLKFAYPVLLLAIYGILGLFASLSIFLIGGNILGALNIYDGNLYMVLFALSLTVAFYLFSALLGGTFKGIELALHGKRISMKEFFYSSFYNSARVFGAVLLRVFLCLLGWGLAYFITGTFGNLMEMPFLLLFVALGLMLSFLISVPFALLLPYASLKEKSSLLDAVKMSLRAFKKSPISAVLVELGKGLVMFLTLIPLLGLLSYFVLFPLWMGFAVKKAYELEG